MSRNFKRLNNCVNKIGDAATAQCGHFSLAYCIGCHTSYVYRYFQPRPSREGLPDVNGPLAFCLASKAIINGTGKSSRFSIGKTEEGVGLLLSTEVPHLVAAFQFE